MTIRDPWPDLQTPGWQRTCRTLHLWSQLVGKTRLALAPMMNHWWQLPLYVSVRGLTTSPMPCGDRAVEVELDLLAHRLEIRSSDGGRAGFPLAGGTLASFHGRYVDALKAEGVHVKLHPLAVEIPETVYLDRDAEERPYDPDWARRFHQALVQVDRLLQRFRASFQGKASPVHFFWGSFDLAVTRFSGRRAPRFSGSVPHCPERVMVEAYSHEVSSAGFWPGDASHPPLLYSYAYPPPPGFAAARIPAPARYDAGLGEFVLEWDDVRRSASPDVTVSTFLESTYAAAADLAGWPREELERARG